VWGLGRVQERIALALAENADRVVELLVGGSLDSGDKKTLIQLLD
jgi:hypothetical protein